MTSSLRERPPAQPPRASGSEPKVHQRVFSASWHAVALHHTTNMPSNAAQQNIWKQMNYTPPRGPCNHKESLLSPKCPCLRFMLHPLKVTSSFSCDGCGHHASFHNMASPADDAVIARWTSEQPTSTTPAEPAPRSRKRPRRALLEAGPSVTNGSVVSAPSASAPSPTDAETDAFDASFLFSEDVEWVGNGGSSEAGGSSSRMAQRQGSKTWGDRFSSWSFGRAAAEEPVKTPPKRQDTTKRKKSGRQQPRHMRDEEDEVRSEIVDLD
ncbi:hypothetical protein DIS24_g10492 [Lasiodiplodia hormozganensis]|uniref:Uncharacterized protein n=1 Tax=Lasiodiplodia hormozganensis TaxID=869390 RepID=A0AA40CHT2_9PEZI|nr:hypothetical protein DIS24_g10492 [Lasiodiplodia hormozganensis]